VLPLEYVLMQVCAHVVLPLQPITHVRSDLHVPVHDAYSDAHMPLDESACAWHAVHVPPLDVWQLPW